MVQVAMKYVRTLAPQVYQVVYCWLSIESVKSLLPPYSITKVVAASATLAAKPGSGIAQKNMSVFKKTWLENVTLLTDAVNAITPLLDFTSVTG